MFSIERKEGRPSYRSVAAYSCEAFMSFLVLSCLLNLSPAQAMPKAPDFKLDLRSSVKQEKKPA